MYKPVGIDIHLMRRYTTTVVKTGGGMLIPAHYIVEKWKVVVEVLANIILCYLQTNIRIYELTTLFMGMRSEKQKSYKLVCCKRAISQLDVGIYLRL